MFDGRETIVPLNNPQTFQANLVTDLMHQSVSATTGHAQAVAPPTIAQQTDIVNFELGLFSAQLADYQAGLLNQYGATGRGAWSLGAKLLPGNQRHAGRRPDRRGVQSHGIHAVFVVGKPEIRKPERLGSGSRASGHRRGRKAFQLTSLDRHRRARTER